MVRAFLLPMVPCMKRQCLPGCSLSPDLPLSIEYALLKALEKGSSKRHDDVASFIAALQASLPIPGQFVPSTFRPRPVKLFQMLAPAVAPLFFYKGAQ